MSEVNIFLPAGTLLHGGQYRIESHVASGGFGNTYLATDVNLKAKVAIKEFFIKTINHREDDSCTVSVSNNANEEMFNSLRDKFKKEAQRIFKIQHNNVVRVFALFEEYGTVYYSMDYIDGESLNSRLKREGALPESLVRSVFSQMLDALDVVHGAGLLHLDIKPHNIMLTPDGVAKLIDFGASKHANQAEATTITGFAFTPEYAPPELTNQEYDEIGPWTDIYSLGITLYRLLSGAAIPSKREIRVKGAEAFTYSRPVSDAMKQLIVSMTQGASERRPQSIAQLRALAAGLEKEPVPEPVAQPEVLPDEKTFSVVDSTKKDNAAASEVKSQVNASISEKEPLAAEDKTVNIADSAKKDRAVASQVVTTKSVDEPSVAEERTVSLSEESQEVSSPVKAEKKPRAKWIIAACIVGLVAIVGAIWLANSSSSLSSPQLVDVPGSQSFEVNGVKFTMVPVKGGTFTMGATAEQGNEAESEENPSHQVTVSSFMIGQTEVTQELWKAVMGWNPSKWNGPKLPVEEVSWDRCQEFIKELNELTGENFRLPTEAEWEYAARGGVKSLGYKYSGSNNVDDVAWYSVNSNVSGIVFETHDVATKRPNELGIYDMSGNVWEWCQDWYGESYYSSSPSSNPTGPESGSYRVCRGGSGDNDAGGCRIASRGRCSSRGGNLGLRLAL